MKVETTRFGQLEIPVEGEYLFPLGLLGLEELRRFCLVPHPGGAALQWLQSMESADVAFPVCDPRRFVADYHVALKISELTPLALSTLEEAQVLAILRVPAKPDKPTLNLLGPLILNPARRLGMQYVVNSGRWTSRHEIG
ncbi:MAG: flagellar assembly protein FliW [Planctomycetota bacterium]